VSEQVVRGFWEEARLHPEHVAIVDVDGTEWTAGALAARTNQLSNAMLADEVGFGRDAAIFTWNRADTLALVLASFQIGSYHTMVNTHLAEPEVAYIVGDARPDLLFVDHHTVDFARSAVEKAGLEESVLRSLDPDLGIVTLDEWIASRPDSRPEQRGIGTFMMYTSGTSGRPKGVRPQVSNADPDAGAAGSAGGVTRFRIDPKTWVGNGIHLVASQLYHAAPLINALQALHLGQKVVLMERFDAETALALIDRHHVTWTFMVPTMLQRILDLPDDVRAKYDTSSLTHVIHAGAPCPPHLKYRAIESFGPVLWEYYSSTEGGGTSIDSEEWLAHPGSVGKAWAGAEIKIFDDDGDELPPGEIGGVYMLNARRFQYHNDPEKTASITRGDYVTAGDLGHLDDEGYLYLADRRSDLILVGGVNVYPAEVEAVLTSHPYVADAAVVGRDDPDLGQTVHAVIAPRPGAPEPDLLVAELTDFVAGQLSSQKRPRSYELRDELPRTGSGKLLRRELR
jgi:long-chain acyl-CoA synthetase